MPFSEVYQRQAALLVRLLPYVAHEEGFALKGGTAINLFTRDMPRLSVDIDLAYLPVASRRESLRAIDAAMKQIAARIRKVFPAVQITGSELKLEKTLVRLLVRHEGAQVKIEVTPVLRGCVYEPELGSVSPAVEATFGFAEMQVVSFADLYAGKIVAALDRQHPRDLFDVRGLLANEGIDDALRRAFIVYLISHNRPMAELLAPTRKPVAEEFRREFEGLTEEAITADDLSTAREELIADIVGQLPDAHRRFLLSFKRGQPDWNLLEAPDAAHLPAVLWKQQNLNKLSDEQRAKLVARLEMLLYP